MKQKNLWSMLRYLATAAILSGVAGFANIALSEESPGVPADEISDGRPITLEGGLSISPVPGWKVERKSLGMGLVMREVLPELKPNAIDYSKPKFARNITVLTVNQPRFMDEKGLEEAKAEITKIMTKDQSLKDFQITEAKAFDYKGKNDGFVIFSQLTVNNFQMMQMQVLVSGEKKSYLLTYSDLAANFANPASYDAAWKSMTSIVVEGLPPVRFEKEIQYGVAGGLALLAVIVPFGFARWSSARRIKKMADDLQYDWDHGSTKSDADYDLSDIHSLSATRDVKRKKMSKKSKNDEFEDEMPVSDLQEFQEVSSFSTLHSRFA